MDHFFSGVGGSVFSQRVDHIFLDDRNLSAIPVQDDEKIHEPFLHPDVGDINAPDLIRPSNGEIS